MISATMQDDRITQSCRRTQKDRMMDTVHPQSTRSFKQAKERKQYSKASHRAAIWYLCACELAVEAWPGTRAKLG